MEDVLDITGMAPGVELAARLAAINPADLDDDYDVLELVAACDRMRSWLDATQLAAVAEFARRPMLFGLSPDVARAKRGPLGRCGEATPMTRSVPGCRSRQDRQAFGWVWRSNWPGR